MIHNTDDTQHSKQLGLIKYLYTIYVDTFSIELWVIDLIAAQMFPTTKKFKGSGNELIHYFVWVGGKNCSNYFLAAVMTFDLSLFFFLRIRHNYWQTLTDPRRPDGLEESANETFAYRQTLASLWKIGYSTERWHVEDESY